MPTAYYIFSPEVTRKLVLEEDFQGIDKYIKNPELSFEESTDLPSFLDTFYNKPETPEHSTILAAYQIGIRAVELDKQRVLEHLGNRLYFGYTPDGNSYEFFQLATETKKFHLIEVLWNIALKKGHQEAAKRAMGFASRILLRGTQDDQELFELFSKYCLCILYIFIYIF